MCDARKFTTSESSVIDISPSYRPFMVMLNTDKINATTALLTPSFLTYIVENEVFSAAVISLPVTHAYRVRDCWLQHNFNVVWPPLSQGSVLFHRPFTSAIAFVMVVNGSVSPRHTQTHTSFPHLARACLYYPLWCLNDQISVISNVSESHFYSGFFFYIRSLSGLLR